MDHTQELQKALQELRRITGITLDVSTESPEQAEHALAQIRCLCTAYKEKYNKTDFLQSLLTGGIPSYDVNDRASRLHINVNERRVLFLLETKSLDETVTEILKSLFPSQTKTYLVPVSEKAAAILRPMRAAETADSVRGIARTIVDTLNTEALAHVRLAYSSIIGDAVRPARRLSGGEPGTESRQTVLFRADGFPV